MVSHEKKRRYLKKTAIDFRKGAPRGNAHKQINQLRILEACWKKSIMVMHYNFLWLDLKWVVSATFYIRTLYPYFFPNIRISYFLHNYMKALIIVLT